MPEYCSVSEVGWKQEEVTLSYNLDPGAKRFKLNEIFKTIYAKCSLVQITLSNLDETSFSSS